MLTCGTLQAVGCRLQRSPYVLEVKQGSSIVRHVAFQLTKFGMRLYGFPFSKFDKRVAAAFVVLSGLRCEYTNRLFQWEL